MSLIGWIGQAPRRPPAADRQLPFCRRCHGTGHALRGVVHSPVAFGRLTGLQIAIERLEHVNSAADGGSNQRWRRGTRKHADLPASEEMVLARPQPFDRRSREWPVSAPGSHWKPRRDRRFSTLLSHSDRGQRRAALGHRTNPLPREKAAGILAASRKDRNHAD